MFNEPGNILLSVSNLPSTPTRSRLKQGQIEMANDMNNMIFKDTTPRAQVPKYDDNDDNDKAHDLLESKVKCAYILSSSLSLGSKTRLISYRSPLFSTTSSPLQI